jgi:hypothetical protein
MLNDIAIKHINAQSIVDKLSALTTGNLVPSAVA